MSKTVKTLAETAAMTPEGRYDYLVEQVKEHKVLWTCLLYTSDAADE